MNNKKITHLAKYCLEVVIVLLFSIVWICYYNEFTFSAHSWQGACTVIVTFFLVYIYLCDLYKAFRFATSSLSDTVVSQFIAFGIADLLMYIVACISYRNYVNIIPGAITVVVQLIYCIIIISVARLCLYRTIRPLDAVVIYGHIIESTNVNEFVDKIENKFGHLYTIKEIIDENTESDILEKTIINCETVFLFDVSEIHRRSIIKACFENHKNFLFTPRIEDLICGGAAPRYLVDTPLLKYEYENEKKSYHAIKRSVDIVVSLVILILSLPITLITSLAIKLEDGGPVLFRQKRCTKDGKVFEILKFRSMIVDADSKGVRPTVKGDSRVTKVGGFIRATRIDEIPQMINILLGDMSFVGPRPERIEHIEQYSKEFPEFKYRLKVKGGLTGYAQVYGKYNTAPYDKLRLDLYYIENRSLIMDFKLILLTIRTIFQKESTEGF